MKKARVRKAAPKVSRSARITSLIPPRASREEARSGPRMVTKEWERDCSAPTRWYCSLGASRLTATSEAGCWKAFISPPTALSA